jgi:hypothetical protein
MGQIAASEAKHEKKNKKKWKKKTKKKKGEVESLQESTSCVLASHSIALSQQLS